MSEALVSKLKQSPCIKRIATFKELNLEFIMAEANIFHLQSPSSLPLPTAFFFFAFFRLAVARPRRAPDNPTADGGK